MEDVDHSRMEFFHDAGSVDMSVERPEILGRPKGIHGLSKVCPGLIFPVPVGEITLVSRQMGHASLTLLEWADLIESERQAVPRSHLEE